MTVGVEEERKLRGEVVDVEAGGEREGDFLDGGRAGFANVVAGNGDGVPLGKMAAAPGENVGDDAHGGAHGIDISAAGDVFLEDIVLHGAGKFLQAGALAFRDGYVQAEEDGGRCVDGHGGGNSFEGVAVEKSFHVFEGIDGHADFADFAEGERVVGVHADLRGQIEGDGEAGLALAQEIAIALVGFSGGAEAGVLAHSPEAAAVHRRVDAASERVFARIAEGRFRFGVSDGVGIVDAFKWNAGEGGEFRLAFGGGGFDFGIGHGMLNTTNSKSTPDRVGAATTSWTCETELRRKTQTGTLRRWRRR